MNRKPKWQIVIEALTRGLEVKLPLRDSTTLTLVMDENGELYSKHAVWNNAECTGEPEYRYIKESVLVNHFIKMCDQIDEESIVGLGFSLTMQNIHNSPTNPLKWE